MSKNSSDDWSFGERIVKKQKRFRYTPLEERKMLHFFAHQLRGGNPKAKFGPAIWDQYKQFNKESTKSTYGLESHFRKIMIPNLLKYHAEMQKEDFFLLLRYFKIRLNGDQLRKLEHIFNCCLETEMDGCFLSACSLEPGNISIFPTREERRTICGLDGDEDMEDDGSDEEQGSLENNEESILTVVIDEDAADGDVQLLNSGQAIKSAPMSSATTTKRVLETRRDRIRRSDASTSTADCPVIPHFREIGIQCNSPHIQSFPSSSNVTTRPMTRSLAHKTSKSKNQTSISQCVIVKTTDFSYPSLVTTRTGICDVMSKKLEVYEKSPVKTRSQKRMLCEVASPAYSLDSSNASSVILPIKSTQFVQTKNLKKKLLANVCNIVDHGVSAVNRLMDGVPQNRIENFQLAQKQLEWILRDDFLRTTPQKSKRMVSI